MIEAKYTKLFKTWLTEPYTEGGSTTNEQFLLASFTNTTFNSSMASDLVNMLKSVFDYYEIGDLDDMSKFMIDTFGEYYQYYYDIITNYRKEYDYALNNKRVITKNDKLNMVGNTNIVNDSEDKQTEYQLPNKVIDDSYRSTPSNIIDTNTNNVNDKNYTNDTSRDSVTTTEFNNEFIDLKNKYMNQIRNVYREFAMKFKDCFYQVY